MQKIALVLIIAYAGLSNTVSAQIDESQTGAWYMYFWNTSFGEGKLGLQGDIQYRNWDLIGDLEQLLLRGGLTYKPVQEVTLTLGYANIQTGAFGESNATNGENRIYQEALIPQKLGGRVLLTHRFRFEQRFVEDQDFRTRFRYNIFVNIPFNRSSLEQGAVYLALYNEIFINGQRSIGDSRSVQLFDRNRLYTGIGYSLANNLRVQGGWMQQTTDQWQKGQLQLSLHHKI